MSETCIVPHATVITVSSYSETPLFSYPLLTRIAGPFLCKMRRGKESRRNSSPVFGLAYFNRVQHKQPGCFSSKTCLSIGEGNLPGWQPSHLFAPLYNMGTSPLQGCTREGRKQEKKHILRHLITTAYLLQYLYLSSQLLYLCCSPSPNHILFNCHDAEWQSSGRHRAAPYFYFFY